MSSSKLRLKRTPAEQAERDLRKARKAARKAAKRGDKYIDDYTEHDHARKRRRTDDDHGPSWDALDDSDAEYGPQPAASGSGSHRAHKVDYDYIKAQVEEERFREKMFGAMDDDDRLDSVEAALNSYAHVPRRWRGGGMDRMDDELDIQPQHMEDEDYAEWIRAGMWRKKHAAEHEEQMRRQAEHKAREEREKALREETRRLERAAEEERRMRKRVKERMREVEARELYDTRWKAFLAPASVASEDKMLRFEDIPWPVMASAVSLRDEQHARVRIEDLTGEAISLFLLPPSEHDAPSADPSKERKEKLRETMLRFHPDKFEGRIMKRVREKDRERVQEAVGIVARTLNSLMGEAK